MMSKSLFSKEDSHSGSGCLGVASDRVNHLPVVHLFRFRQDGFVNFKHRSPPPALSPINRPVDAMVHQPHEEGAVAGIVRRDGQGEH